MHGNEQRALHHTESMDGVRERAFNLVSIIVLSQWSVQFSSCTTHSTNWKQGFSIEFRKSIEFILDGDDDDGHYMF